MLFNFKDPRNLSNLEIAFQAIMANKMRSILTALGIIFGVAAVIAMMAIGQGAKKEILDQLELIGVNNIVVTPITEQNEGKLNEAENERSLKKFSKGLDMQDVYSIRKIIPHIKNISPEVVYNTAAIYRSKYRSVKLIGVQNDYFKLSNIDLYRGNFFAPSQSKKGLAVCIIGNGIYKKFFTGIDPIGEHIKVGDQWLKIIGVTKEKKISDHARESLGIRNYNMDIYTPIQTVFIRYENRGLLKADDSEGGDGMVFYINGEEQGSQRPKSYHQLDKLVLGVNDVKYLSQTADVLQRMLQRKHNDVIDFEIKIPIQLLQQQQDTKDIFNNILFAIACISLLVGGIGIMNIMLASVLERTKEIGTRLAIGAKRSDIISQFLFESILISLSGGIIGITFGVGASWIITSFWDVETIISYPSIIVSFAVATGVGLIFGISPARKAALQNPVESLRYE